MYAHHGKAHAASRDAWMYSWNTSQPSSQVRWVAYDTTRKTRQSDSMRWKRDYDRRLGRGHSEVVKAAKRPTE